MDLPVFALAVFKQRVASVHTINGLSPRDNSLGLSDILDDGSVTSQRTSQVILQVIPWIHSTTERRNGGGMNQETTRKTC